MAQVKEFAAKVLAEMKSAVSRNTDAGKGRADFGILLRYESEWAYALLTNLLEEHVNDTTEISEASLKPFIDFLQSRYDLIKNSDAIYNHNPYSPANSACILLAKNLFEAAVPADKSKQNDLHYYDYLFGGVRINQFISSRGRLGDLQLHEFFWGDDGTPVETLACLERYREKISNNEDCFPPHVCLSAPSLQARPNGQLTLDEILRLVSHSDQVGSYVKAINAKKTPGEMDALRKNLVDLVSQENFTPKYTYNHKPNQSNANLLRNGYLKALSVTNMTTLAKLLHKSVRKSDWKEFVSAIDDDGFDQLILPKLVDKTPDGSMLLASHPEKFKSFVSAQEWCENGESDLNNALLFLLTDLYMRKRSREGIYTGTFGGLLGHRREDKEGAAAVFQAFLQNKDYRLSQLETYLKDTNNTVHLTALTSDRLFYLTDKAHLLGPGLRESTDNLAKIAITLSREDRKLWKGMINEVTNNVLQSYIDSSGGLIACIQAPEHYKQGNDIYNKAVLFILTECYLRNRGKQGMHKGALSEKASAYTGGWFGGFTKTDKIDAATVFQGFLASQHAPNHLSEYLRETAQEKYEKIMRDRYARSSELATLVSQADEVCKPEYYLPPEQRSSMLSYFSK